VKNFDLRLKIEKDNKGREMLSKSKIFRRKKTILVNNENLSLSYGGETIWVYKKDESFGTKFFIFAWPEFYLEPLSLGRVKEMFEIQKILFDNDISTEPKEIVTCSVNNEQVGYGIVMEKAISVGETPHMNSPEMITWWESFIKVIHENDIVLSRLWSDKKIKKELIDSYNLIATRNGYRLIDLGEIYFN